MHAWIGAAPRQRGSSEACKFRHAIFGASSTAFGKICPYAITTITSGLSATISATASGARIRTGCSTGTPYCSASTLIFGAVSSSLRPTGLSGCVTSATTSISWIISNHRKHGSPISPVPMKTTRISLSQSR